MYTYNFTYLDCSLELIRPARMLGNIFFIVNNWCLINKLAWEQISWHFYCLFVKDQTLKWKIKQCIIPRGMLIIKAVYGDSALLYRLKSCYTPIPKKGRFWFHRWPTYERADLVLSLKSYSISFRSIIFKLDINVYGHSISVRLDC